MKRRKYLLSASCLLLFVLLASVSPAAPPVEQLPDQSMPAMKAALAQCNNALGQCRGGLNQCNTALGQCNADLAEWQAHPRFSVLNPRGDRPPITAVPPTARLSSLQGKTLAIVGNYNPTVAPLATAFAQAGYTVIFVSDLPVAAGQSPRPITLPGVMNMSLVDFEKNPMQADAIIVAHGF
jgi:hypothetical protein